MKRILIWLLATLTIVVLLFGYRTSRQGAMVSAPPAAVSGALGTTPSTSRSQQSTGRSGAGQSGSESGSSSGSSGSSSSGSGSTPSPATTTVTGDTASTVWGDVQVALTIQNGKITDVAVPVYPDGNGRDAEINSYALPILVQETLKAQSAQIDMISGATVTSGGYVQSLQSALDKAGL